MGIDRDIELRNTLKLQFTFQQKQKLAILVQVF